MHWMYARFSLRFYISCLFSILIIVLGSVLIYTQQRHNSQFLLANSQQRLDTLENTLSQRLEHSLQNINTSLTLMQSNGVTLANTEQDLTHWLPLIHPLLSATPNVTTLLVGEPDGRSLIFHLTQRQSKRDELLAPQATELVIDIMSPDHDTKRFYFNKQYQLLGETIITLADNESSFDVRKRPWFAPTLNHKGIYITSPYLFHGKQNIGLTLSVGDSRQQRVWAADLLLTDISALLKEELPNADTFLLQAPHFNLLASSRRQPEGSSLPEVNEIFGLAPLLEKPSLQHWRKNINGETWLGHQQALTLDIGLDHSLDLRLATLVPYSVLMADALKFGREQIWLTLLIILLCLPVVMLVSRTMTRPLAQMAQDMKAINHFDFSCFKPRRYFYKELDDQACTMALVNNTLADFAKELSLLSQSDDFNGFLQRVGISITQLGGGQRCLLYHVEQEGDNCTLVLLDKKRQHRIVLPEGLSDEALSNFMLATFSEQALRFETPWLLHDRFGKLNGVILLGMSHSAPALPMGKRRFIGHYCDLANIALEGMRLFEQQRLMTQSMVRVLAAGIDAKSPHTSKHCQRVPELTLMLAKAVHNSDSGIYADFKMTDQEWEELYLAAWLHDCGKLVTPEYVLNKATKLETLYNRLHEIRMRFEVLKRDADVRYWQGIANGEPEAVLAAQRQQAQQQLDHDFEFIAQLNKGEVAINPAQQARLNQVANQTWLRTLNNRIGLSWEEEQRLCPDTQLPAWEPLLADLPGHHIPYLPEERITPDNRWGITLTQPPLKQHLGERYNLLVKHGTLTDEERYTINAHAVHTLTMLSELHYPDHLSQVTLLAASHHENMDGSGYPRNIKAAELPLQTRMLTLADVFEALTAVDRPYKQANGLQKTLLIMAGMAARQHLDAALFRFFVEQEVYLEYGRLYLDAEQLDAVDKPQVLAVSEGNAEGQC
ncbi:HD-GYP domain-containing protein [Oceanisphaera pacifica]|uniref:HD-GYP domain-containing protein n=1 Tax=Oceanisphaera pacifica TaxID=2818389 RepID=A0ABS3NE14_9GAMM|nr:HD domain-containing phosphohydrolase [Oceanisphaera pacifica]MBO1518833.1 hypothetical protein [Oceanisphaera pacifica]